MSMTRFAKLVLLTSTF